MRPPLLFATLAGLAAVSAAAGALAQTDAPMRRAGLWQTTMTMPGQAHDVTMRICTDPAFERRQSVLSSPMQRGDGAPNCSVHEVHRTLTGMAFRSVCTNHGVTSTTDGITSGDFNSRYHVDITTRSTPGDGVRHMSMEGRFLGPCGAEEHPGDVSMVLPGGRVMRMGSGMAMGRPR